MECALIIDVKPRVSDVFDQVWRTLAVLFVWDVLITIIYYVLPFRAPALPLTIFGSALALFLGFRANSTYQRWWEGRVLWGQMINASRNLVRLSISVLSAPEAATLGRDRVAPGRVRACAALPVAPAASGCGAGITAGCR